MNIVYQIIEHFGTQQKFGDLVEKSQQTISLWANEGKIPVEPVNYALLIEQWTNGKFPRYKIRPDIYPPP